MRDERDFEVEFEEDDCTFEIEFENFQTADNGGYEVGYDKGYEIGHFEGLAEGHETGYNKGHSKGVAEGYNNGLQDGKQQGLEEGFFAGQKSEYDRFWDDYQQNGELGDYSDLFSGSGWTAATLNPKYDMKPTRAENMFRYTLNLNIDLVEYFKKLGRTLDFSKSSNLGNTFAYSTITHLGVIDSSNVTTLVQTFFNTSKLETIDKLILKNNGSQGFTRTFTSCKALVNITIEGVIGKDISFSDAKLLSKASITSIMTAVSTTATLTVTFSKVAVDNAFETSPGASDGSTSPRWLDLVALRPNATIALA